jgi:Uma2 family endonuclease
MSTVATSIQYSPEELLTRLDGDAYELVGGELVERKMGAKSSFIAGKIYARLDRFCDDHRLGWVFPEGTSFQCFPDDLDKVRRADVSFLRFGRLPREQPPEGHIRIAPDLAVEVVSPQDLAYDVDNKVEDYLQAGVRLVWVVNPATRTVRVHYADGPGATLRADGELDGGDALPGFRCPIRDLFLLPQPAA